MRYRFAIAAAAMTIAAAGAADAAPKNSAKAEKAPHAAAGGGGTDGSWLFEVTTTSGSCPGLIPTSLTFKEGRLVDAAGARAAVWGYVDDDGTIVTRFTQDVHVARAYGQLRGGSGSGAWSSNTDYCGGTWRATRRGAERAAQ